MRQARLMVLLMLAAAARVSPEEEAARGVRLLYPPNHSVVSGPVRLMAATAKEADPPAATLDGRPLALTKLLYDPRWRLAGKLKETSELVGDRRSAALWVATLDLPPGAHTVIVGGQRLDLWRTGDAAVPADYQGCSSHTAVGDADQLDCVGCHEQPESALGEARTPKSCEACHDEDSVQLIHKHVAPPLSRCALCHDPHGTARPKLLVEAKEALCSRCHEAGHSKE